MTWTLYRTLCMNLQWLAEILKRRLIDGICFEPLAEEFGLSPRHVKNIVYKAQDTLFKHI